MAAAAEKTAQQGKPLREAAVAKVASPRQPAARRRRLRPDRRPTEPRPGGGREDLLSQTEKGQPQMRGEGRGAREDRGQGDF